MKKMYAIVIDKGNLSIRTVLDKPKYHEYMKRQVWSEHGAGKLYFFFKTENDARTGLIALIHDRIKVLNAAIGDYLPDSTLINWEYQR